MGRKTDPETPDVHAPNDQPVRSTGEPSQKAPQRVAAAGELSLSGPRAVVRRADRAAGRAVLYGMLAAAVAIGVSVYLAQGFAQREARAARSPARALAGDDDGAPIVLAWSVAHPHWGTEAVLIRRDGRARYLLDPPAGGGAPIRTELTLPPDDVAELERRVIAARPCELASQRRVGRTHESRPTLELALPDAHCAVTLWFDEWRENERARPMAAIVTELRDSLRHAATQ